MALKRNADGSYEIKTMKDAVAALNLMDELTNEIKELEAKYGINEMMQDTVGLKKSVTAFMVAKKKKEIQLPDGRYGKIIEAVHRKTWVATDEDMPDDAPEGAMSLKTALEKKFSKNPDRARKLFMRMTKRIVDPEKIDQQVAEGKVKLEDIAPAYMETYKAPYLRIFGEGEVDE